MAVWAIAWAGSKPLASLADGLLAGTVGLRWTGFLLALPALIPITVLIVLMISVFECEPGNLGRTYGLAHIAVVRVRGEVVRARGVLPSQRPDAAMETAPRNARSRRDAAEPVPAAAG